MATRRHGDLHRTAARIELERADFELREGGERLRNAPSRFGRLGNMARGAALRVSRALAVRESLMDASLVAGLDAVVFDTSVGNRAASAFPDPVDQSTTVDVETEVGPLYLHADDQVMTPFIRQYGHWEADESAFLRRTLKDGDTFIDVGANVGYFSVLASELVGPTGRVVAVEPEARNVCLLKANLWRGGCANAIVLPIAAHGANGFVSLRVNEHNRGDHQIGVGDGTTMLVPCARLDDLLCDLRPDVIKVDTQGTDHDVIAGMSGLLAGPAAPTVLCEFWLEGMEDRAVDPHEVAAGYGRMGFELHLLGADGRLERASADEIVAAAAAEAGRYVNVVLRPAATSRPDRV